MELYLYIILIIINLENLVIQELMVYKEQLLKLQIHNSQIVSNTNVTYTHTLYILYIESKYNDKLPIKHPKYRN